MQKKKRGESKERKRGVAERKVLKISFYSERARGGG